MRRVYIAENAELSQRHPKQIVFKVGYTDRSIEERLAELNGDGAPIYNCGKYAGVQLTSESRWCIKRQSIRPDVGSFEELLKQDILQNGGTQASGYSTIKAGEFVGCVEIFCVSTNFKSKYLVVEDGCTVKFRWLFFFKNFWRWRRR